jgi:hypothetical protein
MDAPPRPDRLYRMLAPALLITVASVQIYLAKTHDLTPWKGGGFGMFSTVDDPSARRIRCYAVAEGREVAIAVPDDLNRAAVRLRAMPSQGGLQRMAADLGRMRFVNREYDKNVEAEMRQSASLARKEDLLAACWQPVLGCEAVLPTPLRVWESKEREPRPSELAAVQSVRVELWRYRFDLASRRMIASKAATAVAPARPARGVR